MKDTVPGRRTRCFLTNLLSRVFHSLFFPLFLLPVVNFVCRELVHYFAETTWSVAMATNIGTKDKMASLESGAFKTAITIEKAMALMQDKHTVLVIFFESLFHF